MYAYVVELHIWQQKVGYLSGSCLHSTWSNGLPLATKKDRGQKFVEIYLASNPTAFLHLLTCWGAEQAWLGDRLDTLTGLCSSKQILIRPFMFFSWLRQKNWTKEKIKFPLSITSDEPIVLLLFLFPFLHSLGPEIRGEYSRESLGKGSRSGGLCDVELLSWKEV